jgi:hypothetical protein
MGRIEATRRHGPFDPRFRLLPAPAVPASTRPDFKPAARLGPSIREELAMAAWEGEGGAVH